jgi:PAS domain S-box-containing protein
VLETPDAITMTAVEPPALDGDLAVSLLEAAPEALVLVDEEGQVVFLNRRAEELFGYPREAIAGQSIDLLVPGALCARDSAHRKGYDAAPDPQSMGCADRRVLFGRRREGTELPIEVNFSPVRSPQGAFLALTVRDATERREAERTLREAEERFRLALDEAPIGMALVALDGRFMRVNRALCQIVGYTPEELTCLTLEAIADPDDVDVDAILAGQLARGEIANYQVAKRYRRKDGAVVDALVSRCVLRDREGRAIHYITQMQDMTERRRGEEALRNSEVYFRELVEQAAEGVFIADLDGRYTDVNSAACQMLGYGREELVGKTIVDLIPPGEVPRLAAAREYLLASGRATVSEWTLRREDGVFLPVEVSAKILPDGRWQAFAHDISARKRAETALRESEEALRRAQRVAHLGSWDWDLRTDKVARSDELFAIYGLEPSPEFGSPYSLARFVHPGDVERLTRAVSETISSGASFRVECRIIRPGGIERIVLQQGEIVSQDGRPARLVGTVLDITERKHVERELEESARLLRTVLEQSPVGILLVHAPPDARVEPNRRALEMIGRPVDRIASYRDLLATPEGRALTDDELPSVRALRGDGFAAAEYLLRTPAGEIPVLVSAAPIIGVDGKLLRAVVAFQDITAAKQLERLRAEWSSVVAHDLRQPLNTISLSAQLLEGRGGDARSLTALGQILASAARLDRMISDLMDLSRIDARRLDLARCPVDVPSLVRATVERMALVITDRRLELLVTDDLPQAHADADRVAQILENLLSNAGKYGTAGTPVFVEVGREGDRHVAVAVTNEGKPLASDDMSRMFDRFHRTADAKLAGIGGVGLGLYIARGLVEAHGGRITVASTATGKTTFRFTIPGVKRAAPP